MSHQCETITVAELAEVVSLHRSVVVEVERIARGGAERRVKAEVGGTDLGVIVDVAEEPPELRVGRRVRAGVTGWNNAELPTAVRKRAEIDTDIVDVLESQCEAGRVADGRADDQAIGIVHDSPE